MSVQILGISIRDFYSTSGSDSDNFTLTKIDRTTYLKVKVGAEAYFVKKSKAIQTVGYDEFNNTAKAKAALADCADVEVVDMKLGYSDDRQSWFVSKWQNLEAAGYSPLIFFRDGAHNDYGEIPSPSHQPDWRDLRKRMFEIVNRLRAAGVDVTDFMCNFFYNPERDKFFLLDVTTNQDHKLNQPRTYV
ncbi:MAG: hypothetical protein ACD_21C00063G0001 [uncultured bacterium]|nr:MAG: hypothetical protein ACD_21C00063G0001 [uncultured bacterium]